MKILILFAFTASLLADGGGILVQGDAGPWRATVFANPLPLRAGPVELGVLVETQYGTQQRFAPVLDASVRVTARSAMGEETTLEAKRSGRTLYVARWNAPSAGPYRLTTSIEQNSVRAGFSTAVTALPAAEPIGAFIPLIALVPLGLALFVLNRSLQSRQIGQRRRSFTMANSASK